MSFDIILITNHPNLDKILINLTIYHVSKPRRSCPEASGGRFPREIGTRPKSRAFSPEKSGRSRELGGLMFISLGYRTE
jgi:hypothetical protein